MNLQIIQADIDKSGRGRAFQCPVANALNRTCPGGEWGVDGEFADFWPVDTKTDSMDLSRRLRLSDGAREFLHLFDTGREVTPCTVTLAKN